MFFLGTIEALKVYYNTIRIMIFMMQWMILKMYRINHKLNELQSSH